MEDNSKNNSEKQEKENLLTKRMLDIINKANSKGQARLEFEDFKGKEDLDSTDEAVVIDVQNPSKSYSLYYLIRNLLMNVLPEDENVRNQIYEQKNIFLTRGHRKNESGVRGADGRMGYIEDFQSFLDIIENWMNKSDQNPHTLFTLIYDKNKELGYI